MQPARSDVKAMVTALFTIIGGIERATRRHQGASTLSLLQVLATGAVARPSEIAERQGVHPSLVTRQLNELEDRGYVRIAQDPADGRAWLVRLTSNGRKEVRRLQDVGIDRFSSFVADWDPAELRTLTRLLEKLDRSKTAVTRSHLHPEPASRAEQRRASTSSGVS